MVFEVLTEDQSGMILMRYFFEKYCEETKDLKIFINYRPYKGIGGLKKGSNALSVKSNQLLTELPKRMRAIQEYYRTKDDSLTICVVMDNDKRDTAELREELEQTIHHAKISCDHIFCIAVEELEAWLLGDYFALQAAYPELKDRIISKHSGYRQDSICGTWEFLADLLTKEGIGYFHKLYPTWQEVGKCKAEWAEKIGQHLNIRKNRSSSFNYMLNEVDKRCKPSRS